MYVKSRKIVCQIHGMFYDTLSEVQSVYQVKLVGQLVIAHYLQVPV